MHREKKLFDIPVPSSRDVTYKLSLGGNNDVIYKLFPPRESLASDILAGYGNIEKLFFDGVWLVLYCVQGHNLLAGEHI
jgi:hypothetical protein